MTTVVYKDGILAADTALTRGDWPVMADATKVRRIDGCLYAGAGDPYDIKRFYDWAEQGCPEVDMKKPSPVLRRGDDDDDNSVFIKVDREGFVFISSSYEFPTFIPLGEGPIAFGSGRPYAIGALDAGAGAIDAVLIACRWDEGTRTPVNYVDLKDKGEEMIWVVDHE